MQMYFLWVLIAATAVVPEPAVKSKINSPLLVYVFIRYSINSIGFCVLVVYFSSDVYINFIILR